MSTTAKIAARGCSNTGITEEIAKRFHDQLGKTGVAIIEFTSDARTENKGGDEQVKLTIGTIEVAPEGTAAEHVRELARLLHYERRLAEDGPELDLELDGPAPKPADVLNARYTPHPYLASTLSTDDDAVCDVCGVIEDAPIHADRTKLVDPFGAADTGDQDDEPADPDDPAYERHAFASEDGDEICDVCDQAQDAAVHAT